MKVYISGPMTGYPDFNYPAFVEAATYWRSRGYVVVSPAEINPDTGGEWADYLRSDLRALLECDVIAMLRGWEGSRGANLELYVARALGLEVWDAEARTTVPKLLAVPA